MTSTSGIWGFSHLTRASQHWRLREIKVLSYFVSLSRVISGERERETVTFQTLKNCFSLGRQERLIGVHFRSFLFLFFFRPVFPFKGIRFYRKLGNYIRDEKENWQSRFDSVKVGSTGGTDFIDKIPFISRQRFFLIDTISPTPGYFRTWHLHIILHCSLESTHPLII